MKKILITSALFFVSLVTNAQELEGKWSLLKLLFFGNTIYFDDSNKDKENLLNSWIKMNDAEKDTDLKKEITKNKDLIYDIAKKMFKSDIEFKDIKYEIYLEWTTGNLVYYDQKDETELEKKEVEIKLWHDENLKYRTITFPMFGDFHQSEKLKITLNGNKLVLEDIQKPLEGEVKTEAFIFYYERRAEKKSQESAIPVVFIKGGTFAMGSENGEANEKPVHQVTVSSFYMGKYEVTQAQWLEVMGNDPSNIKGCSNCPVDNVSWDDVQQFLVKLNAKTDKNYRLPTEAEWEYAARGGQNYTYAGSNKIGEVAWYYDNGEIETHPVGQKLANGYGLYDMTGNVSEWCSDWWSSYSNSPSTNPKGSSSANHRVIRGGSFARGNAYSRVTRRDSNKPGDHGGGFGFRVVVSE